LAAERTHCTKNDKVKRRKVKEMKNLKSLLIVFVFALIIGSLTMSFAQTGNGKRGGARDEGSFGAPPPGGPGGLNPRIIEQLNLTDAQKEQIRVLHENARTASEQYFDQLKTIHDQLKTVAEGGTFNEAQAREVLAAKAKITTELELIKLRTDAAIFNLLTAEQRTKLEELKDQHPGPPRVRGDFRPNAPVKSN
jgi:protein CpxP